MHATWSVWTLMVLCIKSNIYRSQRCTEIPQFCPRNVVRQKSGAAWVISADANFPTVVPQIIALHKLGSVPLGVLVVPRIRLTKYGQQAFAFVGPSTWNILLQYTSRILAVFNIWGWPSRFWPFGTPVTALEATSGLLPPRWKTLGIY